MEKPQGRKACPAENAAGEKGRLAAARVQAEWTWDKAAGQVLSDLDSLAKGEAPKDEPLGA